MSLFCKQSLLTWGEILDSFNGKHILKQINTAREILRQKQKRRMVIYVVQNSGITFGPSAVQHLLIVYCYLCIRVIRKYDTVITS